MYEIDSLASGGYTIPRRDRRVRCEKRKFPTRRAIRGRALGSELPLAIESRNGIAHVAPARLT